MSDLARDLPPRVETASDWHAHAIPINRLLAAHAFASWSAYQSDGVVTQVERLRGVLHILRVEADGICRRDDGPLTGAGLLEAIRQTDLRLRHVVDSCRTKNHVRDTRTGRENRSR